MDDGAGLPERDIRVGIFDRRHPTIGIDISVWPGFEFVDLYEGDIEDYVEVSEEHDYLPWVRSTLADFTIQLDGLQAGVGGRYA